jgi:release factor glutamine methyltransferase
MPLMSIEEAHEKGCAVFMGLDLLVSRGALVPRTETELLANTALETLHAMRSDELRVIDICCGVGNLACAIAHRLPSARVWAGDLSGACIDTARRNVSFLGLEGRVSEHQGDLFDAVARLGLEGTVDVIVCNPPYISERRLAGESAHLLELEPREAFDAGPFGLSIHMRVVKEALPFLRPGGALLFEVGLGQDRQVKKLFERTKAYEEIRIVRNEAGEGRLVMGYAAK